MVITFILFFVAGGTHVRAQEMKTEDILPTPGVTEQEVQSTSEYTLPYPGMLPDHPLYNLKRVRDYILERLIADPIKKAEFYILQADKRLQMGVFLAAQGKNVLADSTISKGEKYLEKSQGILTGLKANGTLPAYVVEKYERALGKHAEVIGQLMTTAGEPLTSGLNASMMLISRLISEVPSLK